MGARRTIVVIVLLLVAARSAFCQTGRDTAAVTRALVSKVALELAASMSQGRYSTVDIDSGSTPWSAAAMRALRAALPPSATPRSDTSKYYATQIRFDALKIAGNVGVASVTWTLCSERRLDQHMNWWQNPTQYSLVRTDSGWLVNDRRVLSYVDGRCDAYPGRR